MEKINNIKNHFYYLNNRFYYFVLLVILLISVNFKSENKVENKNEKTAYFASGCFWCVEAIYKSVSGVRDAVSGYAGGHTKNPTYKEISTGDTGHAETVAVYYNPSKVSFKDLLTVFFSSHDPTTLNGQYPDFGTQYRSVAFYKTDEEKLTINKIIAKLNKEKYNGKIVTEVKKIDVFYQAEDYHQNYEENNPNHPYIKKVSIPRLERFKKTCPLLIKKNDK